MGVCTITPTGGGWGNADIRPGAGIDADKLHHRQIISIELFGPTTTITALTKLIALLSSVDGVQIVGVSAAVVTVATGADRTVNVDLQRSTGGAAFATVLTGTILLDDDSVALTPVAGVLDDSTIAEDDLLRLVVTVAGFADAQALGLIVNVTLDHKAA